MKNKKTKSKIFILTFILVLTITATLLILPFANAHTPPWTDIPTFCYVAASPDIIGQNQEMIIVFWIDWIPPTARGKFGDRWIFYVDITAPDQSQETLGPFTSDPVGGGYTFYLPTQIGTYTIVSRFPGQTITGIPDQTDHSSVNDTFAPSTSDPAYFTVQQEPIPNYIETPVTTDYWTRPVYDTNRGWGSVIMGQWLGGPYYESLRETGIKNQAGPESSHILWTRQYWSGGIMGGQSGDTAYYSGVAYEGFSSPMLVLEGRAYYWQRNAPFYGWYCIDLYTGETLYYENDTDGTTPLPVYGQILDYHSPNQHGGMAYLWRTSGVGSNTWEMLDAFTGKSICKIANVSTGGTQFHDNIGSICYINFVNIGTSSNPNYHMQIWNTTEAISWRLEYGVTWPKTLLNGTTDIPVSSQAASNYYWMWRPGAENIGMSTTASGATYDGNNGFTMNISVASILGPRNSVVNQTGNIKAVIPNDLVIVGTDGRNDARGVVQGFLRAYSLKAPDYGNVLYETTFTPPRSASDYPNSSYGGDGSRRNYPVLQMVSPEDGVFAFTEKWTGKTWVYSLETGEQLWEVENDIQWYYYGLDVTIHQGRVYTYGRAGTELNVYNATTGQLLWNWKAPSVGYLESATTNVPLTLAFFVDEIGREKVYFYSTEGAGLNSPVRRDGSIFCIDTNTGELIWRLTCWPGYGNQRLALPVISDGRILVLDVHDNQIYCIGKGPSATTVSAPQIVPTVGSSVMITGTVTDDSPSGRVTTTGSLDFTLRGTPAISDEYMDAWMEYMFHQRPIPVYAEGVEVILETLDPNGNFYSIGNVTSDINGNYGLLWEPPVPGTYQIIARFEGSESYGPSSATAFMGIAKAPSAGATIEPEPATPEPTTPAPTTTEPITPEPTTPEPTTPEPTDPEPTEPAEAPHITTEIAIIAVIAVACVIGVVSYWALRKRK